MQSTRRTSNAIGVIAAIVTFALVGCSQESNPRVDGVVERTMWRLGLPSVSISVVVDGRLAYVKAYGNATVATRYEIGSVTKQFTAASLLLLQQDGKLRLDDPVSKYLPALAGSRQITIRELLDHTSGYTDYYATLSNTAIFNDTSLERLVRNFTSEGLDFQPGTQWSYSNTGYAVLTEIVERVARMRYGSFLQSRIFGPLHMTSAIYLAKPSFGQATAIGYDRVLLGPEAPAKPEGRDWLNGAAGIAMTARDLGIWNAALLNGTLLNADSTKEMFTDQRLRSGGPTGYGLGVFVVHLSNATIVSHTGEVQGFTAANALILEKRFGVAVLCDQENSPAPGYLSGAIAGAFGMFPRSPDSPAGSIPIPPDTNGPGDVQVSRELQRLVHRLALSTLRSSDFTPDEAAIASPERLRHLGIELTRLGAPVTFEAAERHSRGRYTVSSVVVRFRNNRELKVTMAKDQAGKIADLFVYEQ